MILDRLHLQYFRSYKKTVFEFSPGITLIVGPNTAGKTNILEAMHMLAVGKSFRATSDADAIAWGEEIARVTGHAADTKLELVLTHGSVQGEHTPTKKYLVNGVSRRLVDFVGNVRVALFWPEHLELVTDSPSLRRRYLDSVLVQADREYRRNLISYERGLRQRNKLLDLINEGKASRSQLGFWNQLLIKAGGYITDKRMAFIDFINASSLTHISYQIAYDKSIISETRLDQYRDEEVAAKATLVGPHRDDFTFLKQEEVGDKKKEFLALSKFGSRGEQRLAVLWLKLAELAFMEKEVGDRPILVLDDIFSELDEDHRRLVLEVVGQQQTVITSAEEEVVDLLEKLKELKPQVIHLPLRRVS